MDLMYLVERELRRRNYSVGTIRTYLGCLRLFLARCRKEPRRITKEDVRAYLDYLCVNKKSASTLNVTMQALKFALEEILNKKLFVKLPYSKVPKRLPEVLTKEETSILFKVIANPKHSLMVRLLYSTGLRAGELVQLRVKDFQFDKDYGWVRQGKGAKDRLFLLSDMIKAELMDYVSGKKGGSFVFEGRKDGHISKRTLQVVVREAGKRAGLKKRVHPHVLRHSFATHLIENGVDVYTVQLLLGHESPDTTQIYLHMAPGRLNVKSPYDSL